MNKHSSSKSGLFLIELILSIFFFITAMAICLQFFAKGHSLSQDTIAMNHAVLLTQNLSELFLGSHGDYHLVKETYSGQDCISSTLLHSDDHLLLLYDKEWNPVMDLSDAFYLVLSEYSHDQDFAYEDIYVANTKYLSDIEWETDPGLIAAAPDALIHHIQVKKYVR